MIRKNKLGVSIASAIFLASVAAAPVFAAEPVLAARFSQPMAQEATTGDAQLIVKYKAGSNVSGDVALKLTAVRSAASRASVLQSVASTKASLPATPLTATYGSKLGLGADTIRLSRKLNAVEMSKLLTELRADPSVEYVEVDMRMQAFYLPSTSVSALAVAAGRAGNANPQMAPNDPLYATHQWHYSNPNGGINAPAAWEVSTGKGVVVAVLDTGILPEHPDMGSGTHILEGYDFITDTFVSRRATTERVAGGFDLGDWNDDANECPVRNSSWHGTHVAGTVAELTNNNLGVAGVAFDAQVLPVRVLGRCGGYTSDIADAIAWASGATIAGVASNAYPAEVINLSLGGSGACGAYTQAAIDTAVANGATVVVAAGNSNGDAVNSSPANCKNVITVGANRITGGRASYSNYGAIVDIAGPGGGGSEDAGNDGWDGYIAQAGYSGKTSPTSGIYQYAGMAGTSMAAPHVAAVAALVQSALVQLDKSALTPAALETLLKETARPFPVAIPSNRAIGTGIVDANAALAKALKQPCNPEMESCAPTATPLVNKVNVVGLAGVGGSEKLYSFVASAGSVLSIITLGGTGDVSLYVSFNAEPTVANPQFKSTRPGNSETVRVTAPKAGTYYIKVVGASAYTGVTLVARQ